MHLLQLQLFRCPLRSPLKHQEAPAHWYITLQKTRDLQYVELVRNLMAHAQKPDFIFRLNGRVHLNRRGRQFIRLLAAEVCASAVVILDTPHCEVVWEYWLPTPFASFPFTFPPMRHHVPPHSERSIPEVINLFYIQSSMLSNMHALVTGIWRIWQLH